MRTACAYWIITSPIHINVTILMPFYRCNIGKRQGRGYDRFWSKIIHSLIIMLGKKNLTIWWEVKEFDMFIYRSRYITLLTKYSKMLLNFLNPNVCNGLVILKTCLLILYWFNKCQHPPFINFIVKLTLRCFFLANIRPKIHKVNVNKGLPKRKYGDYIVYRIPRHL